MKALGMKQVLHWAVTASLLVLLSGCTVKDKWVYWLNDEGEPVEYQPEVAPQGNGLEYRPERRDFQELGEESVNMGYRDPLSTGFSPRQTHKFLSDYADQLAMKLMDNATHMNQDDLIGVTSFVRLNRSLKESTILGNQLAELMMTELQDYGLSIVDFKVMNTIQVTPSGDLALSREAVDLAQSASMDHILTGTIIERDRGVRMNARIVSLDKKRVVASASVFVPAFVVTSLHTSVSH